MSGRPQTGKNVTVSQGEGSELSRVTKLSQMVFYKVSTMIYKLLIVITGPDMLFSYEKSARFVLRRQKATGGFYNLRSVCIAMGATRLETM